jgi:hypothetical protein
MLKRQRLKIGTATIYLAEKYEDCRVENVAVKFTYFAFKDCQQLKTLRLQG